MEKEEILSVDQYTKFLVLASSYNMQDDNRLLIPFTSGDKIGFVDKEGAIVVKPNSPCTMVIVMTKVTI